MPDVHVRPVTRDDLAACLALRPSEAQARFVATNARSLAEAYVNPNLTPLAVYDAAARGWEHAPPVPMVGFTMLEVAAGVGFILRLMIDEAHQGKGYGRATTVEVIRRLRLDPRVELVATSHRRDNEVAGTLFRSLGFVPWDIAYAADDPDEVYLFLTVGDDGRDHGGRP